MSTAATTAGTGELILLNAIMLACLVLPGLTVSLALTRRPGLSAAAAVPATVGIVGFLAWAFGALHIPFTGVTVTAGWLVALALAALGGLAGVTRSRRARSGPRAADRDLEPAAAATAARRPVEGPWAPWLTAAACGATVFALAVASATVVGSKIVRIGDRGLRSIPQGWDMHWHASLVHWAQRAAVISPTRTGELRYADDARQVYYPTGWHAVCEWAGQIAWRATGRPWETTEVVNLFMALSLAFAAAGSAAAVAWVVTRRALRRAVTANPRFPAPAVTWAACSTAAVAAVLLPAWQIIFFDGSWPAGFGLGLAGVAVAVIAVAAAAPGEATGRLGASWAPCVPAALAALGAAQSHASAATAVALGLGLWLVQQLVRPSAGMSRLRAVAFPGAVAALTAAAFAPQFLVGLGNVSEVTEAAQTQDITRAESWARALFLETKFFDFYGTPTAWHALILLGVAGLAVFTFRGGAWLTATWAVAAVGTAHCLVPFAGGLGATVGAFTSFHYNAGHRVALIAATAVAAGCGALAAAVIFAPLARLTTPRRAAGPGAGPAPLADAAPAPTAESTPPAAPGADAAGTGSAGSENAGARSAEPHPSAPAGGGSHAISGAKARPRTIAAIRREPQLRARPAVAASAAVVACASVVTALWAPAVLGAERQGLDIVAAEGDKQGRMVSAADLRAFDFLRERVAESPERFTVLSAPEEGMGWGYTVADLPMIFTHYLSDRQDDQVDSTTLLFHAEQLSGDPDNPVDQAACRLGVRYIIASPPMFWSWQQAYPSFTRLHEAPGLTPVYSEGAPAPGVAPEAAGGPPEAHIFEVDSWDPQRCPSAR